MKTEKIVSFKYLLKKMRFDFAGKSYQLLTWTEDMGCPSFSLPAIHSCPGRIARDEKDICFGCYAQIGNYGWQGVMDAQAARFAWIKACLRFNPSKIVDTMIGAIEYIGADYFRIHDSGDFFSAEYARTWVDICKALPRVNFWAPTRSYHGAQRIKIAPTLRRLNALSNVTIRPSAIEWDSPAPNRAGFSAGSTAVTSEKALPRDHKLCPKTVTENGTCESCGCRDCWDEPRESVAYLVHGRQGLHKIHAATKNEKAKRAKTVARFAKKLYQLS